MNPIKLLDLKEREALVKLLKEIKAQRNVEKTFLCSQSAISNISGKFIELKIEKICPCFGSLRTTSAHQD